MTKANDLLDSMLTHGLRPGFISQMTGVPVETVLKRPTAVGTSDEEDLSEAMNSLMWAAHQRALFLMEHGSPGMQLRIIMGLLSPAARAVGKQQEHMLEGFREELQALIGADTDGDEDEPDGYNPAIAPAAAFDPDDS